MIGHLLRLSRHSIIYSFGVVVSQLVSFLLLPVYTRYLTVSDYGIFEIFQVTLSVLSIIFVMGLSSALFRSYFNYDDEERRRAVVSTAFVFLTVTSILFTLLMVSLASRFSSLLFDSDEYVFYFQLIFLTVLCDVGIVIGLSVFRAREESVKYALVTLARFVISASLTVVFVVALDRGVRGILEAGLIAAALIYCSLIVSIVRRAGFSFSTAELKRMLSYGLPLVPAGLAAWVLTMADRFYLQFLSTPEDLGLYSLGYKFGLPVQVLIVGPFQLAWAPFMFSIAKESNAREIYSRVLTYFVLVAMFVALALSALSREFVAVMSTPAFHDAYKVVPLIALSYVLYGCYFIFAVGINLEGKTKYVALVALGAAVLNLGLNYLLIPDHGMMGAAVATVISYTMLPIGSFLLSQRYYRIKYEWARVVKIFLAAAIVYAGSVFIDTNSATVSGVLKIVALLGFPILLLLFGFLEPEEAEKAREIIRGAPRYIRQRFGR